MQHASAGAWLDVCVHPEIHRIALLDAPSVLGFTRWREIGARYSLGLVEGLLAPAIAAGRIESQPVRPLAHVMLGALREAALYLAEASDAARAGRELGFVIDRLIASLDATARPSRPGPKRRRAS